MDTEQFNIRLSIELLQDLELIAKLLKMNKSEWVKTKLAESVYEEKNRLLLKLSSLYSAEKVNKEELRKILGKELAEEIDSRHKKSKEAHPKAASYIH